MRRIKANCIGRTYNTDFEPTNAGCLINDNAQQLFFFLSLLLFSTRTMSQEQRDQNQGPRRNRTAPFNARVRNRVQGPTSALTSFLRVNVTCSIAMIRH